MFPGVVGRQLRAPNRQLITLSGFSTLSTTTKLVCPTFTRVNVGDQGWDWLRVDDPTLYSVSADGQTIEGRFDTTIPAAGVTMNTVWKFNALRE